MTIFYILFSSSWTLLRMHVSLFFYLSFRTLRTSRLGNKLRRSLKHYTPSRGLYVTPLRPHICRHCARADASLQTNLVSTHVQCPHRTNKTKKKKEKKKDRLGTGHSQPWTFWARSAILVTTTCFISLSHTTNQYGTRCGNKVSMHPFCTALWWYKCCLLLTTGRVPSCSKPAHVQLETMSVHVWFLHLTAHSPFPTKCLPSSPLQRSLCWNGRSGGLCGSSPSSYISYIATNYSAKLSCRFLNLESFWRAP